MSCNSFADVMRGVLLAAMAMLVLIVPATAVQAQTVVNICSRTAVVQTAILEKITGSPSPICSTVTDTQLASITSIDDIFSYPHSSVLPADFAGLTGLTSLTFFLATALTTVPDDAFADLTSLETLTFTLITSKLTTLGADAFNGLTNLADLQLFGNSLTTLDEDIFDGLTNLATLNLSSNLLTTLPADVFDGLTNLAILNLLANDLTTLPADIFDGLTNLATLELSSNLLTTLDADIFDGTALVDLRISSNSLTALDANIFDGLTAALEVLDLSDNLFTALPVDIFDGLTSLDFLDLNCNYFTTLDLDIFDPLATTLTYLDLQSDSFTTPLSETAIRAKFTDPNFFLSADAPVCSRVKLSPTSLTVAEGSTGMYSVALRSQPGDDVTVAITSDNTDVTVSPTSLTFSTSNWDTAQTLTVSAAQDTDEADESATLILDPSGGGYDDADDVVSTALTVTVTDDGGYGLTVTPTSLTIAEGSTGTYTVELNTQPTAQVTVAIGSDNSDVTTSLTMLTFTTSNWNSAQTVTVSAAQDADTADDTAVLTLNPSGADYASVSDATVTVTVTDDDLPGICGRTEAVRMAILGEITGSPTCTTVTDTQLASIPRLEFFDYPNSSILPADFAGLTGLTFLSLLFSPALTTVPDDAFADLTDLEYLAIASSPTLTTLGADAFAGLDGLEDLLLEFNGLTTLDEDIFDGLDGLEDLRLNGNSLTALDEDIFDGLTNLDTLNLGSNSLTTLDADIFDGLTNLDTLNLSDNLLTTLDADIFDGLTALTRLNLQENSLTTLPADIFDGLTNLATLELSSNLLTTLDADIFDGTDLTDLRISSNSLRTLDTDIFDGLTALEVLKLDDNSLTALPVDIFDGLTSLDFLDLNCNYFTTLDLDIFNPFAASLTYLDLQSDSFTTPPTEAAIQAKFPSIAEWYTGTAFCYRVKVSPTSLTVTEGAPGTFAVTLREEPILDNVMVTISSDNPEVTVSPTTPLIFTTTNSATAQMVTVTAAQDADQADESATLTLDPSGDEYDFASSTALAVAVKDDDIAVTVSFESDTYTAAEGDDVTVTVELSAKPQRSVTVPITTSNQGGASSDDYDVPDDVTFGAAERSTTFTFTATQDTLDDDDESVKLGFGTIADTNVSVGTPDETTVSIKDDDHPVVTVSFGASAYSANEGGTVEVTVELNADPERTVSIPITKTEEDGASSADYSGVPDNVMFNAGEESKTITFMATQDTLDDDDESVKLGFGPITDARVSEGTTIETTVSIKDDDHPRVTVSFEESTYSADEGGTVDVKVQLSADPERPVSIPITKTEQDGASSADYSGVPDNVMFDAGETSKTITFAATQDTLDDDDESVKLGFGTITDARVSEGTPAETTVSIKDDDVPQVSVSFREIAYSANEAGTGTADVTVQLSADPERTVTIAILTTNQDGASSADYSGVPSSVTFNDGGVPEMTFTITATDDAIDDDGESVLLSFIGLPSGGVEPGTNAQATFTINDDDGAGVTVSTVSGSSGSALTIAEGGSGTYTVVLDSQPTADVTVTIHDPSGSSGVTAGVTAEPASLTFNTSNWSSSQPVTVNAAQDSDAKDGTATVTHTVTSTDSDYDGTPAAKVRVVVRDDDDIAVTVSFGRATYSVAEGGSVTVEVALSEDPKRTVSIPITKTEQDGASSADYSVMPASDVTFNAGETSKTISFAATQDTENDDGESVKLAFGNITDAQVSAGTPAETTVSITDDDVPDVTVSFGEMSYTVAEDEEVEVTVELSEAPERRVEIPLTVANLGGASDADYKKVETPVIFESGDTKQTFLFMARADTETEEDEMVEIKVVAESLSLGVTPGSPATTTVTITESAPSRRPTPTLSRVGGGSRGGGGGGGEPEPEPVGYLENPGPASFQSGIGVISGWVCEADRVEIEIETAGGAVSMLEAAYGTERLDTARMCEDTDNGFGLLFNWNLLGDGEHEVAASVDGVELGRATVTVTTLGVEFLRGVEGACMVDDFPSPGQTVTLEWQQTSQNFVIASGTAPTGESGVGSLDVGFLENPGPNSFQSGIGVISGWVCEAEEVEVEIGNLGRQLAGYGTERLDTLEVCGDTDNGFGLLFNWNLLGDGEHTVEAFVDGVELGRATVRVTTLGEEFLRGAERECVVEDFPMLEAAVTLEWQQTSQNFVITDME